MLIFNQIHIKQKWTRPQTKIDEHVKHCIIWSSGSRKNNDRRADPWNFTFVKYKRTHGTFSAYLTALVAFLPKSFLTSPFKSNTCIIIKLLVLLKSRLMPRGYKPRLHSHYTFKTIPVLLMRRKCTNKLSESQHFFQGDYPHFSISLLTHSSYIPLISW